MEIEYQIERIELWDDKLRAIVKIIDPRLKRLGLDKHFGIIHGRRPLIENLPRYVGSKESHFVEGIYLPGSLKEDPEKIKEAVEEKTKEWLEKEYLPKFTDEYLSEFAKVVKWLDKNKLGFGGSVKGPEEIGGKIEYWVPMVYARPPSGTGVELLMKWKREGFEPKDRGRVFNVDIPVVDEELDLLLRKINVEVDEFKIDLKKNPSKKYESKVIEV